MAERGYQSDLMCVKNGSQKFVCEPFFIEKLNANLLQNRQKKDTMYANEW